MEADWEVEIGDSAPVIDAFWDGLVDLRLSPARAATLPEALQFPPLAAALVQLNSAASPVWTAKCDVWHPEEFDRDELDARPGEGNCAIACYIDLLPLSDAQWTSVEQIVVACRAICAGLRSTMLRCCRADLIIRRAHIVVPHRAEIGTTAYLTACGSTPEQADAILASALGVLVESVLHLWNPETAALKLQLESAGE